MRTDSVPGPPTPELRWVSRLARLRPTPADRAAAAELARQPLDWARVLRLIAHHGVSAAVDDALRSGALPAPAHLRSAVAATRLHAASANLRRLARWRALNAAFAAAGIRAVTMKGFATALTVYGDPERRSVGDLDFLVAPEQVPAALALLAAQGYFPTATWARALRHVGTDYAIQRTHELQLGGAGDLAIDLHWHAGPRGSVPPTEELLGAAVARVDGEAPYWTLSDGDALAHLVAHGHKSQWTRLRWVVDVAETLALLDDEARRHARTQLARLGLLPALATVCALIERRWETPPPTSALGPLSPPTARLLQHVQRVQERQHDVTRKRDGWRPLRLLRDRLAWHPSAPQALLEATRPTHQDWAERPLPPVLRPAYRLVRPLRVLREALHRPPRARRARSAGPLTFVTAIYDDGPDSEIGGRGWHVDTYLSSLRNIANLGCPLVVYCAPHRVSEVRDAIAPHFATFSVRPHRLTDAPWAELLLRRKREYRHTLTLNDRNEFLCFQKLRWLADVSAERPFGHARTYWIDAGLTHHGIFPERVGGVELRVDIPDAHYHPANPANIFRPALADGLAAATPQDRLLCFALPFRGQQTEYDAVAATLLGAPPGTVSIADHVVGGLFGGHEAAIAAVAERFFALLPRLLQHRIYTLEEQILSILYRVTPELFEVRRFATWHFHSPGERTSYLPTDGDSFYKRVAELAPVAGT